MSTIFTTGAFLEPIKTIDSLGNEIWRWVVSEFVDDSFKNGNVYNPQETASSREMLEMLEE